MAILSLEKATTARSFFPSPLKSPTAMEYGLESTAMPARVSSCASVDGMAKKKNSPAAQEILLDGTKAFLHGRGRENWKQSVALIPVPGGLPHISRFSKGAHPPAGGQG